MLGAPETIGQMYIDATLCHHHATPYHNEHAHERRAGDIATVCMQLEGGRENALVDGVTRQSDVTKCRGPCQNLLSGGISGRNLRNRSGQATVNDMSCQVATFGHVAEHRSKHDVAEHMHHGDVAEHL